jgi:HemK-related putative methylase
VPGGLDEEHQSFVQAYHRVREAEGWARDHGEYYRRLPEVAPGDPQQAIWRMRQQSFETFLSQVLEPLEKTRGVPLTIVDAGAGNGWLSNRLAERGHQLVAVDVQSDDRHGLGALVHYESSFLAVRTTYDRLPLTDDTADVVVFNASLHYADEVFRTFAEALRVLRGGGRFVILDSPVYKHPESGRRMVDEKKRSHEDLYGVSTNGSVEKGYLTTEQLDRLGEQFGLEWESIDPGFGIRWTVQRWATRLLKHREAGRMPVLVATRPAERELPVPSAHERHSWLVQKLGCLWRWVRAVLFLRGRYDTFAVETVQGYSLIVMSGVFNPALFSSSQWFPQLMREGELAVGRKVLDMGTGAGLTAVAAASHGSQVVAVDINPAAVESTRRNALLNRVDRMMEVREGDLFGPVKGERFDTIFFNPPFYEGLPAGELDHAWRGKDIAERLSRGVRRHLQPLGAAYVVLSSEGIPGRFLRAFREHGFRIEVVRMFDLISETQAVYRIHRMNKGL